MADQGTTNANDPALLLLLISLAEGPKHGHAMLLDVERFSGVRLGPGTLYGALARLEETAQVEALPLDGRRRPYRLTEKGRQGLAQRLTRLERAVATGIARVAS